MPHPCQRVSVVKRTRISAWIRAFRPPAQINLALPMLVGLSWRLPCDARFDPMPLVETLMISLLLQAMILYSNEASDAATDDPTACTVISGGAGVGATGQLPVHQLRAAALVAGGAGLLLCFVLGGIFLAATWLLAAVLVWAYDGRALQLSRHPAGALCQALGIGIVAPMLGAGALAARPEWIDLAIGLCLGFAGFLLTALPDEVADRKVGKNTWVVCYGARSAFIAMLIALALAALLLLGFRAPGQCAAWWAAGRTLDGVVMLVLACAMLAVWADGTRAIRDGLLSCRGLAPQRAGEGAATRAPVHRSLVGAGLIMLVLWVLWALR